MKVLIIDDDNSYRIFLEKMLLKYGYDIVASLPNLEKALHSIETLKPELVLIDNNLSGHETGLQFSKTIEKNINCQIVIISGEIPSDILHKDVTSSNLSFYQKSEKIDGLLVHIKQIFYNKELREKLELEFKYNKSIINSSLDAIITIDNKGIVTEFNPAATLIFGYERREAIGTPLTKLIIPDNYVDAHIKGINRFLQTNEPKILSKRIEIEAKRKDNKIIQTELIVLRNDDEKHFTAFIRDITLEKVQEMELKKAFLKIIEQEKMANLGLISAGIAHELNSPLGAILNSAERIYDLNEIPQNIKENVNLIIKSTLKCREVVSNLLGSIRENNDESISEIGLILRDWFEIYKSILSERNIVLELNIDSNLLAKIKPISLNQIITNLVMNSVFELQNEDKSLKKIKISALEESDIIKIIIKDNGKGFPKFILENSITPFNTNKEKGQGTGLGLWICQELVQESKGSILLKNNKGAEVTVILKKVK